MSTTTTNYSFIKPEKTDPADITATNENWDKLDNELKTSNAVFKAVGENILELQTAVGVLTPICSTEDLTAGESELETGKLYFVYE